MRNLSIIDRQLPELLQALQHVLLDVLILLIRLQQRDGIIVILAIHLVNFFQLNFVLTEHIT